MKRICGLLLCLGLSALPIKGGATDYSTLDHLQNKLLVSYGETVKSAGTPEAVKQYLRAKDHQNLKKSISEIEAFFKRYDDFNLDKIDLFMHNALSDVRSKYLQARPHLKKKTIKKINKEILEIEKNYSDYGLRKSNIGKEKDYLRVESGRDFFWGVGRFSNLLKEGLGEKANRVWGVKLLPFIDTPKELWPVADDFMQLLYSSYFKTRRNKPNQAPIIDSLRKISQKLAESKGTETKWFGLENLQPMPLDGETINIFVFMHANSYYDTSVQGTLQLDGLSSIGNVDVIFPKFLADRMVKSDHIVTVGHGDIIGKTEGIIRSKKLNKFFIAPEGLTPVGFYEMRPLVDIFTESMYALIERGIKMNLYPISFPDNFRFLNDYRRPIEGNKLAYGNIHAPLNTEELVEILKVTKDKQAAAHLIRWIWFAELINDSERDIGMPKPTQMKEWFDGMIWGNL